MTTERRWITGDDTAHLKFVDDPVTGLVVKHVLWNSWDDTYWHADETGIDYYGPFFSLDDVKAGMADYAAYLDGKPVLCLNPQEDDVDNNAAANAFARMFTVNPDLHKHINVKIERAADEMTTGVLASLLTIEKAPYTNDGIALIRRAFERAATPERIEAAQRYLVEHPEEFRVFAEAMDQYLLAMPEDAPPHSTVEETLNSLTKVEP